jgi:hypothetical protein
MTTPKETYEYCEELIENEIKKVKEYGANKLNNTIDDWVDEAMWDFKLDKKSYDPEVIKKVMVFGYYTALNLAVDKLLIGDDEE